MNSRFALIIGVCLAAGIACGQAAPAATPSGSTGAAAATSQPLAFATSSLEDSDLKFGFFPSPPEPTFEAIMRHFEDLGDHADFILIQPHVPWQDFAKGIEGDSPARQDIRNQVILAQQNGLGVAFVVDPLNGLNRREFFDLPASWRNNFGDPQVRSAYINFSIWLAQEFKPTYLGLASEINTYMDAHPQDVDHYLTLYQQTYQSIKEVSPVTRVFVTFQWDDLNNMMPQAAEGRPAGQINWEQIEAFEPRLDLWAISSYPYFIFNGGEAIPADYYRPLLSRTNKPLAVAEGGFSSRPVGPIQVDEEDQSAYLQAIHAQLGERLSFWVYILLNDLNMQAISTEMAERGRSQQDIDTLSMFAGVGLRQADGSAKPALELWDSFRTEGR